MADIPTLTIEESRKNAIIAVVAIAVFAVLFVGSIFLIDSIPASGQGGGAQVGATTPAEPFYTLLIGSDSRKGTALYTGKSTEHAQIDQHADIMTLVRVDPATYTITLVTIPRDTVLEGANSRINDTLLKGDPVKTVEAAEVLTGVNIDYYMMTTFTTFESLINRMSGVTVDVPKTITVPDPLTAKDIRIQAGENQTLNGSEALVLARARKEYGENQDALRQVNVRNIEIAMIEKALNIQGQEETNLVLTDLEENTTTNMDFPLVGRYLMDFIAAKERVKIYSCTGPHEGGKNSEGTWVIDENNETWEALMAAVSAGEDPSDIVEPPHFA